LCNIPDAQIQAIYDRAESQVMTTAEQMGIDLRGVETLDLPVAVPPPSPNLGAAQARLNEEIRNRSLMAELAQLLARQKGDAQMLECVRQQAGVLLDLTDAVVFLMQAGGKSLVGVAAGQQRQRLADFSISLGASGIGEAVLQRKPVLLQKQQGVLNLVEDQLRRAFGSDSLMCIPLVAGNRCLGMLVAGTEAWREPELKRQEKYLLAFGTQAGQALDMAARERGEWDRRIGKLREEHLQNSRKVAHEANNPLTIIKSYLGVVDEKLSRQEPVSGELTVLNEEIDRVGHIIKEFAGVTAPPPSTAVDLNRVTSDIVRLFRESRFLPASVQIAARISEQSCEISGNVDTLKQILVNLIKNAVEALPKGGRIEVVNLGSKFRDNQEYFELHIKDNGPGLPDEVLAKLFSPVRSSKAGENRGLGLSIVHGLVKKLGGQISCNSSPLGTSFEIQLPGRASTR
jgi:signal transduction histidine kinase